MIRTNARIVGVACTAVALLGVLMGGSALAQTITFTQISTPFNSPIGADYHEPTNSLILSVNYSGGQPHNLERVQFDGTHVQYSGLAGLTDELKIATVRSIGNPGGFTVGDVFTGNGNDGEIVRVADGGATVLNPWVSLPGSGNGLMRGGLYVDRTGVFGGDLIVVTTAGEVWRIDVTGTPTMLAAIGTHLEGVVTVPNDVARYGPLAGKILAGAENQGLLYAIDAAGVVSSYALGVNVEDIDFITANDAFFGVNFGTGRILGAPASTFAGMVDDILLTQEFPSGNAGLFRLFWDGAALQAAPFQIGAGSAGVGQWEHVTFAPAAVTPFPSCSIAPMTSFSVALGTPVTFTIGGGDTEPTDLVTLDVAGLPAGANLNPPLPASGNPVSTTFSWTPTSVGTEVIQFIATDSTGLTTVCSAVVAITCPTMASSSTYGSGFLGTLGVPGLSLSGAPVMGSSISLDIDNSSTQPTTGCLLFGFSPSDLSFPGIGGHLLVDPFDAGTAVLEFVLPIGVGAFPIAVPTGQEFCGVSLYLQAIESDGGASIAPYSFTPGLNVVIGS